MLENHMEKYVYRVKEIIREISDSCEKTRSENK